MAIKYIILVIWLIGWSLACSISYYSLSVIIQKEKLDSIIKSANLIDKLVLIVVAYNILNY